MIQRNAPQKSRSSLGIRTRGLWQCCEASWSADCCRCSFEDEMLGQCYRNILITWSLITGVIPQKVQLEVLTQPLPPCSPLLDPGIWSLHILRKSVSTGHEQISRCLSLCFHESTGSEGRQLVPSSPCPLGKLQSFFIPTLMTVKNVLVQGAENTTQMGLTQNCIQWIPYLKKFQRYISFRGILIQRLSPGISASFSFFLLFSLYSFLWLLHPQARAPHGSSSRLTPFLHTSIQQMTLLVVSAYW